MKEENIKNEPVNNNKKKNTTIIITILILLIVVAIVFAYFKLNDKPNSGDNKPDIQVDNTTKYSQYRLSSNSLENFDLHFLQLENNNKNKVYSPLSIKYALGMLKEGTNGETRNQIDNIIGTYNTKKYINSENMSFANALFIKDSYKDSIKDTYINTLTSKYNAEVMYDSFETPNEFMG